MTDCRCGFAENHCLLGHHHVVESLAEACNAKAEAATRPRAVA